MNSLHCINETPFYGYEIIIKVRRPTSQQLFLDNVPNGTLAIVIRSVFPIPLSLDKFSSLLYNRKTSYFARPLEDELAFLVL